MANDYQMRKALEAARRSEGEQKDVSTLQTAELLEALDSAQQAIEAFEADFPEVSPKIRTRGEATGRYDLAAVKEAISERTDRLLERYEEIQDREPPAPQDPYSSPSPAHTPQPQPLSEEDLKKASEEYQSFFLVENAVRSIELHRSEVDHLPKMREEIGRIKKQVGSFTQENPDAPIGAVTGKDNATAKDVTAAFDRVSKYWKAQHASLFTNDNPAYPKKHSYETDLKTAINTQKFMETYQAEDKSFQLIEPAPEPTTEPSEPTLGDKASAAREIIEARIKARKTQKGDVEAAKPDGKKSHADKIQSERDAAKESEAGPSR